MRLFTCKKYDFLIGKNLPSLPASSPRHPKPGWGRACFTEDLSEFRQIYLRIQVFVGKLTLSKDRDKVDFNCVESHSQRSAVRWQFRSLRIATRLISTTLKATHNAPLFDGNFAL